MPEVIAGLLAQRVAQAEDTAPEILDPMTGGTLAGSEFERHILKYIVERMNLTPPMQEVSLRRMKPNRSEEALTGTVAEAWLEQGRAERIEKGQAGIVLRLLELRFREVPGTARERVPGASASELEAWAEAVPVAARLDDALAARPGR